MGWARARLARRLRKAGVPPPPAPYTVDAWCEAIGAARGRPLLIRGERLGTEFPPGFLVPLDQADYILVDTALPPLARAQTVLHEVAHLVLGHDGDAHVDVDPALEAEAELAADLLSQQMTRAAASTADTSGPEAAMSRAPIPRWSSMWWTDRRTDWHVNQLWMTLRAGMPDARIVSTTTGTQAPVEVGGRRHRHRRVIEVHDALRLLRPWCSGQVHASAVQRAKRYQLDPADVAAVAEAAAVAVALRRRQAALPQAGDSPYVAAPPDVSDVRAEARRLARMSRALHDSPLVAAEVDCWVPVIAPGETLQASPPTALVHGLSVTPLPNGRARPSSPASAR
ncbi:DUF6545 domain-containing protein [Micromonospora chalcea]|uniref:DUF6545 domain-containing protein n=1 Tax=Micromonospora chalcea TaxID=1874 RepID=UPI0016570BB1|nr:DUF6545 domain-containing protein [Micromonospora chalcea]MBC8991525.1 ImmA/IrrE family metallo-endopeptidase [Micromonospora chalcea]